jgi:hypothetical protein
LRGRCLDPTVVATHSRDIGDDQRGPGRRLFDGGGRVERGDEVAARTVAGRAFRRG